jgi:putative phosphoribosyl transferase
MSVRGQFIDRDDAGRQLGRALHAHRGDRPVIVLALPRGGVPVGGRVAESLDAPLDVCLVRKLGVPGHEEFAMGAIASGGVRVLNPDVVVPLRISPSAITEVIARETAELHRRELAYRGDRHFPSLVGETVILVDDGAATGASMRVAVEALREAGPRRIVAAVPVASREAAQMLRRVADECVTLIQPEPFYAVGYWYSDFSETSDDDVRDELARARRRWDATDRAHTGARP